MRKAWQDPVVDVTGRPYLDTGEAKLARVEWRYKFGARFLRQTQSNLATNYYNADTLPQAPHLYIWRNISRNMAALGQLRQEVASLIHIVTWGGASFAGLPWVSPSPVQATTRLSEAAQKTSSPAW